MAVKKFLEAKYDLLNLDNYYRVYINRICLERKGRLRLQKERGEKA